jgi:hypothetical protein
MPEQDKTLNSELPTVDSALAPLTGSEDLNRKKRSIDDENEIDKKRGSGGLDSLGGGRLP